MRADRCPSTRGRYQDYDQESITTAARRVVNRVWKQAENDRKDLEHKLETNNQKVISTYQDGFRQGIIAVRYIHDAYVLPKNLAPSFVLGFLSCLVGVLTGLFLLSYMKDLMNI